MKKILKTLFLVPLLVLIGCEQTPTIDEDSELEHNTEENIHSIKVGDVEIILIEDCEYIVYKEAEGTTHTYGYMAHKGNCSNPIHCHNQNQLEHFENSISN